MIMQAIAETLFDVVYLISVITIGILMIRGSRGNRQFRLFGIMAVVLGAGDLSILFRGRLLSVRRGWKIIRFRWGLESGSLPLP